MIPTTYTAQVLADLCRPESIEEFFEERYEIKADGLWVRDAQPGALVANRDIAEWHPRRDRGLPALPFPFTSRELAAFMLAGYGGGLLEKFQSGATGERDEGALTDLGKNADKARGVWCEAYDLVIEAAQLFGRDDEGIRRSADWLLDVARSTESPKQRRDRLLRWFDEEALNLGNSGAVERVFKREQRTKPKADRSNIGKAIVKARKERDADTRPDPLRGVLGM